MLYQIELKTKDNRLFFIGTLHNFEYAVELVNSIWRMGIPEMKIVKEEIAEVRLTISRK